MTEEDSTLGPCVMYPEFKVNPVTLRLSAARDGAGIAKKLEITGCRHCRR